MKDEINNPVAAAFRVQLFEVDIAVDLYQFIIMIIIIIIIIIIINLIYIAQFNTDSILTVLYIVIKYITNAIYAHMDIHETVMLIHIYMSTHIYIH